MEENEMVENNALTPDADIEQPDVNQEETPKAYTSEQVKELMKKRIDRSHNSIFNRYGVKSWEELDDICNNYRSQQNEFGKLTARNSELVRENSFLRNNIEPTKYNDIIAYFKGNNIEFSEEELTKALETHPEWLKRPKINLQIKSRLGVENQPQTQETEEQKRKRLFGI